jgi:type IV pilus biogenesis protein CpaD/CtpE
MTIRKLFLLLIATALITGCAGTTRMVTDTAAASVGAFAANKLGNGNPLITAVGAGAGVLLGETLNYANDNHAKKAFAEGFDRGRSDAVKQQYWVMVNQQKAAEGHEFDEHISLYEIPVPEQQIDGVILKPTTKILRIEE